MKRIKYWKVIKDGVDIETANNMLKAQAVGGHLYDRLAVRLKGDGNIYEYGIDLMSRNFTAKVVLHGTWEILIPDDGEEERLDKLRKIVKDENFLTVNYEAIDNMNIDAIWKKVVDCIDSNKAKYAVIKAIVENKLYKEK